MNSLSATLIALKHKKMMAEKAKAGGETPKAEGNTMKNALVSKISNTIFKVMSNDK